MKTTLSTPQDLTVSPNTDRIAMALATPQTCIPSITASSMKQLLPEQRVLNTSVTALPFKTSMRTILKWAHQRESKAVCVANVHMLMEARWHMAFAQVLKNADMVTPDGMPLVWMMRLLGQKSQDRVAGMEILHSLCEEASREQVKVFFLGSQQLILERMRTRLEKEYPNLDIVAMRPLPFRPLTTAEDEALIQEIHESGAGLVFLSLGCPKQEKWMAEHQGKVRAVMIGLGGAFPVYAGLKKWAPRWVRQMGLEWLYRLLQEPKRLIGRYFQTIPPFMFLAFAQLLSYYFTPRALRSVTNL